MGMLCCAAKCCGCIVLSQLCALLLPLLVLAALAALFYLYAIPWGEDQIRDALGLASDVDIGDLNASYVAANSCSGCVFGSNTQWPTNTTGALHFLDSQAGTTASTVIATSLAGAAAAGVGSMLWASFLPSAASALSFSSGFYEMTHIVEQAQFIGMISQLQIDGAPTFLYQFSKELSWTNFNIAKSSDDSDDSDDSNGSSSSSSSGRRLADSSASSSGSGSTGAVAAAGETGPARYAALVGVDENDLFFYTLMTFAVVLAVFHVLFLLLVMVVGFASKKESFGEVARKWYRKVIWASVLALLLAQYMFAMAGCYFASEGSSGSASGSSTRYALGIVALGAVVLLALGLGMLVVGNNTEELRDVGTYEHDQRPFSSKYSAYYDEYNFDNRFFFVPRILLAVTTGAIVGVVRDATVQLLCIMGVTVLYLILLLVRQPNLLRFLYYIGLASVFMKVVLICLMLVVARDDYFPQTVRDNVAYGIIGVNMFIFFLLFLRQVYTIVHKMVVACRNKKKGLDSNSSDATDINLEVGNSTTASTDRRGYGRMDSTTANPRGLDQPWDGGKHHHQQLYQQQQGYNGAGGYEAYAQQHQQEPHHEPVPMLELSNSGVSTGRSNHQYQQQYQQQQQQQQRFQAPPPVSRNQQYSFGGSSRGGNAFATTSQPQPEPQPQPAPVPQYDVLAAYLGTAKTQEEQNYSTSPQQSASTQALAATRTSLQPKRESRVSVVRGNQSYEGSFSGADARASAAVKAGYAGSFSGADPYAGSFSGADPYTGSFSGTGSRGPRASQPQQDLQRSQRKGSVNVDALNVDVDVDALDVDIDDDVVAEPPVPVPARQQLAAATAAADEIGSSRTRQSYMAFSDSTMSSGGSQPGSSRSGLAVESHDSFEDEAADEKDELGGMAGFHGSPQVKMSILSDGSDSFSGDSSDWFARRSKTELSAASSDDLDDQSAEGKSYEPNDLATAGQRGSVFSSSQSGDSYDSYGFHGSKTSFMTQDSGESGEGSNDSSRGVKLGATSRSISYLDNLGDDKNDLGDDSDSDEEYYPTSGRDTNTSVQSFVSARSDDSVGFYFENERPTTVRVDDLQTKKL